MIYERGGGRSEEVIFLDRAKRWRNGETASVSVLGIVGESIVVLIALFIIIRVINIFSQHSSN